MLPDPFNSFINNLHNLLNSCSLIREKISGIYLSTTPLPAYPFIVINFNKASNSGNYLKYAYSIDFDVAVFFRDQDQLNSTYIAESINNLLKLENFRSANYKVIGLQKQEINLVKSKDTLTSKLNINYLSSIRQK